MTPLGIFQRHSVRQSSAQGEDGNILKTIVVPFGKKGIECFAPNLLPWLLILLTIEQYMHFYE